MHGTGLGCGKSDLKSVFINFELHLEPHACNKLFDSVLIVMIARVGLSESHCVDAVSVLVGERNHVCGLYNMDNMLSAYIVHNANSAYNVHSARTVYVV